MQVTDIVREPRRRAAAREGVVQGYLSRLAADPALHGRLRVELPEPLLELLVAGQLVAAPRQLLEAIDVRAVADDGPLPYRTLREEIALQPQKLLELRMRARLGNDDGVAASTREVEPDEVDFLPGVVLEVPEDVY